jgi:uridine kinase
VRTVLLRSGHAGADAKHAVRPDYIAPDLEDAVEWILGGHAALTRRLAPIAVEASRGHRLVLIGGLARAGKSYAAQVLKELLHALGRQAHAVSLDGWLKPKSERAEGAGVRDRFDLAKASAVIATVAGSRSRVVLSEPIYDRYARNAEAQCIEHSVGPQDVLIVEGVPALLLDELLGQPGAMTVYVDVASAEREARLKQDYGWRDVSVEDQSLILAARDIDETPIVEQSKANARWVVGQEALVERKE